MEMEINRISTPETDTTYPKTQDYDSLAIGLSQILADTYTLQHQIEHSQEQQSDELSSSVQKELQHQQEDLSHATNAIAERIYTLVTPGTSEPEITRPSFVPEVTERQSSSEAIASLVEGHKMVAHHLFGVLSLPETQNNDVISSFLNQRAEIHQNNAQTLRSFL